MKAPRLTSFAVVALLLTLAIAMLAPHQLGVTLYKLSLVTLAAVLGYWIDRAVFPYARPHTCLIKAASLSANGEYEGARSRRMVGTLATLRRAILMSSVILAIALGA